MGRCRNRTAGLRRVLPQLRGWLLRAVLVSVGDRAAAQDLVDEAFARAWASWRTVSRHPAPTAWVVRTAPNENISRWRRRRREVSVPDPGMVADSPAADWAADSPVDARIMAALMRLSARQRQVVALRLLLDLDTGRTAEVLGIAPGTVMAHLGRAMAALRDDLMPGRQQETRSFICGHDFSQRDPTALPRATHVEQSQRSAAK